MAKKQKSKSRVFKVGDKVVVKGTKALQQPYSFLRAGLKGVVREVYGIGKDSSVGVQLHRSFPGHLLGEKLSKPTGFYFYPSELKLA